jgi:prophage maintenance system killer protein
MCSRRKRGKRKKYPFVKIGKILKRLEAEQAELYGFVEDSVWYPNERFIEEAHELCIREYGGYMGYETGIGLYKVILKEVKESEGIFGKAAVLLRRLAVRPTVFQDGNHRVAWMATVTFLNNNGKRIWTDDSEAIYTFIKEIQAYSIEQIARWLENGPQTETSNKSP